MAKKEKKSISATNDLESFYTKNPNFDLLSFDFYNKEDLAGLKKQLQVAGTADVDITAKVETFKTQQRLQSLNMSSQAAQSLANMGITSANQLARIPRKVFVSEHAGLLGMTQQDAELIHKNATGIRNKTMQIWASVNGTMASSYFSNSAIDSVSDQLKEKFQDLPSYQDLFGSLDYCSCDECRSIFGASAYLVDLLRIIDEYITKPNAATILPEFQFSARRPDIGEIELTCANTNTLVPYLQIVNERLFASAQATLGAAGTDAVMQQMATTLVYPQALPFNAPLDQVKVLLNKIGVTYGAILSAWKIPTNTVAARSLGLSPEQQSIVITEITDASKIAPFYNVTDITVLNDADTFLAKTWMSFADLITLLNQDLSQAEQTAGLQVNFFINQGLAGKWITLQQNGGTGPFLLNNLGVAQLDKINRLQRLAAITGQTIQDIDWALRCINPGVAPVIKIEALASMHLLLDAGTKLQLDFSTSTVLAGPIKTYGLGINKAGSPFDQLFNPGGFSQHQGTYHPAGNTLNPTYTDTPLPWTPGDVDMTSVNNISRVLPGLGISLSDANALGLFLYGKTEQKLTVDVLSVLYRHALISNALQLPMSQYLLFLTLNKLTDPKSPTLIEINALADNSAWMNNTGLSVYQLDYVINGNANVYVNPLYIPNTVTQWLQGLWTTIKTDSPTAQTDITAQVAVLFGADSKLTTSLMTMATAAVPLPTGITNWANAFLTPGPDGITPLYLPYVQSVLNWVSRWLVLTQSLNISNTMVINIVACPTAYQLPLTFNSISWQSIQCMQQIMQMMQTYGDYQQNLLQFISQVSGVKPTDADLLVLQKATNWDPEQVKQLIVTPGPLAGDTTICGLLADLQTCFSLINKLQANPAFMSSITALADLPAANNWTQYLQTAASVLTKTAGVYGDQWSTIWTTLSGNIAINLRDALLSLVLSQLNTLYPGIKAARNVYEFLLTDVEIGADTSISYIKEALNSAQIYLQRCRLRLEPGVEDMSQIQDVWWEWMMNYRIWEANREIFVYPENYLIPNLRKNTTPEFANLSQMLQQSDITKAYVGSAFTNYINGFAEVAELKPVDAYRTQIDDTDTLFLLSRSKTGPYTFYYCEQPESMPWTPWTKIDLAINSAHCSLIYAFNRPFLFWNEIKKNNTSAVSGSGGNVATNNSVTYTASVMYSFLNQEGKWVQPQTLVDQEIVLFKSDPDDAKQIVLIDNALFSGLFDMDAPYWNKVFAFNVTADNYVDTPAFKAGAERLLVMYGPNISNTGTTQDPGTAAPDSNPNSTAFWTNLHDRTEDHNRMVLGQLSGNLSLRPVSILNFSLEEDVLIHREEFLLVDPYQAQSPLSLIKAEMQSSGDVMQISHCGQPITDNRNAMGAVSLNSGSAATPIVGDSFISVGISSPQSTAIYNALKTASIIDANGNVLPAAMATLDLYKVLAGITVINSFSPIQYSTVLQVLFTHMGATELFSNVAGNQVKVIPVSTQPGWFVFFAGDEIFLLSPKTIIEGKPLFSTFTKGLTVGDPLISPAFAIMQYQGVKPGSITAAASAKILDALTSFGLIANGRPTVNATLSNVTMALGNLVLQQVITDLQIPYIYNALVNSQIIFSNDFMEGNIDAGKSGQIYTALQSFSLIDPNGRINGDILTGVNVQAALSNLLLQGTITQSQIAGIYQTLAQAPKAIALTYVNQGVAQSITQTANFHFDVIRLSTGAINKISRALFVDGVDSLLDLKTQQIPVTPILPFDRFGPSTQNLNWPSALDATQVDFDGLYGQYFWEIFYHIPMLVAYSLNTNQQFQDAQKWLQYVFDPTTPEVFVTADVIVMETGQAISSKQAAGIITQLGTNNIGSPPAPVLTNGVVNPNFVATTDLSFLKTADPSLTATQIMMVRNILLNYQLNASSSHFWNFRPFRNHNLQSLEEMLDDSNPAIKVYNDDPFDPFAIARLRIGAFEKSTLIQYIDNLIAWGDQLFTQDSWESITAAYMLYVYAYDLLGPKPEEVGEAPGSNITLNFNEIKAKYPDGIPQFLIDLEHFIPGGTGPDTPMLGHAFNDLYVYFCVPENSNLMARWDTVQDRMYKINNSLNINGVFRQLALFQPPINPLDLVKASAAGNNIQAMASSNSLLSPYRYSSAINAANGLCSILIELGNSLLSVIEKNDAEKLSVIRNTQEGQILNLITQTKTDRISELQATIASLNANMESANNRLNFYTTAIANNLSDYEKTSLAAMEAALAFNILGSISKTAATIGYAVPQMGSPFAMTYGGVQIGNALNAASGVFEIGSEISTYISQRASTMGGYERRSDDWGLQKQMAQGDVNSITQQIAAANYQLQSAQQDLVVQKKSISQNVAIENYLEQKFNNQDLYQWMMGRISAVYFQTYSLALQMARQAEAAFQFETDSSQTFLSFDYWDNLHKGLTAGEGLRLALNRMDVSYRTQDTRRLEIEKNISLAMLAPDQLLALKTTGQCSFSLKESLFDYDYPGQYARKIKTVSVSIPVIVGPYQNLKAVLTQTKNSVVTQPDIKVVNYLLGTSPNKPASGLREDWAKNQSIAISKGTDDSGMFVLDFQDQRYLPFENTGAVSDWTLSMPIETNRIDFNQLSDVIITIRYTALFDGTLQTNVEQALAQVPTTGGVYVDSAMQSNTWQSFLIDHSNSTTQTLELTIDPAQIGFFKSLTYSEIILQLNPASGISIPDGSAFISLEAGIQQPPILTFNGGQATAQGLNWNAKTMSNSWKFVFNLNDPKIGQLLTNGFIDGNKLLDMQVVVLYQAKVF